MRGTGNKNGGKMKIWLSFLISWVMGYSFAQYDGKDSLIASRYRPGIMWYNTGWRPAKEGKPRKYDRLIFDLNYSLWEQKGIVPTSPRGSFGWSAHTMWDIPLNEGNGVAFGWGFSYKQQRVGLNTMLVQDQGGLHYFPDSLQTGYSRGRLTSHTVQIPVEIRFRSKKWRQVKLHVGASIGYRFASNSVYYQDEQKIRSRNVPDSKGLTYAAHARFGIRNWAFFGEYTIPSFFSNKSSDQWHPLTFGISLSLF